MSSALTGPLPSAAVCTTSPSTSTLTIASAQRAAPLPVLDNDREVDQPKERLVLGLGAVQPDRDRRLRAFEDKALMFQLLDLVQEL